MTKILQTRTMCISVPCHFSPLAAFFSKVSAFQAKRLPTFFVRHETFLGMARAGLALQAEGPRNRRFKKVRDGDFDVFSDGNLRSLLFISKLNGFSPKSLPTFFVKREKTPRMVRVKFASWARGLRNRHFKKCEMESSLRNLVSNPIFSGLSAFQIFCTTFVVTFLPCKITRKSGNAFLYNLR